MIIKIYSELREKKPSEDCKTFNFSHLQKAMNREKKYDKRL